MSCAERPMQRKRSLRRGRSTREFDPSLTLRRATASDSNSAIACLWRLGCAADLGRFTVVATGNGERLRRFLLIQRHLHPGGQLYGHQASSAVVHESAGS